MRCRVTLLQNANTAHTLAQPQERVHMRTRATPPGDRAGRSKCKQPYTSETGAWPLRCIAQPETHKTYASGRGMAQTRRCDTVDLAGRHRPKECFAEAGMRGVSERADHRRASATAQIRPLPVERAVRSAEAALVEGGLPSEAVERGEAGHGDERAVERRRCRTTQRRALPVSGWSAHPARTVVSVLR